jgi:hypothetical protein
LLQNNHVKHGAVVETVRVPIQTFRGSNGDCQGCHRLSGVLMMTVRVPIETVRVQVVTVRVPIDTTSAKVLACCRIIMSIMEVWLAT